MRNHRFFIALCLLSLTANFLFADERLLILGGEKGWPKLESMKGVVKGSGKYGWESVLLDTNSRRVGRDTDMLLDFEDESFSDKTSHYTITQSSMFLSDNAKMGKHSALARGSGGIRLSGNSESIFGSSGTTGSFLIEFWLNPSIAENGEVVLSWRSSRTVVNYPLYQMISASIESNHLLWRFTNVFNGYTKDGGSVTIQSYSIIIPNVWTHHAVSFDVESGLLEYRIDGKLESLAYVTSNGREVGGSVYTPQLGVVADIDICPQYTGLIDDFRILRRAESSVDPELRYDAYKNDGGYFVTEPLLISRGAKLQKIDAVTIEPDQTAVELYVRYGDNYYNWTENEPEWIPVKNHDTFDGMSGMYFQISAELFPDGAGLHSPSITEIDLLFEEIENPLPPFTVNAEAGDGEVTLSWSYSVDETAGGYYVYYGERPGEYLGREAVQGESPVVVGNVTSLTLTGLKNGKIYYFAVASYARNNEQILGELSREVHARPLKSKGLRR